VVRLGTTHGKDTLFAVFRLGTRQTRAFAMHFVLAHGKGFFLKMTFRTFF
jgi:hypothetical protein